MNIQCASCSLGFILSADNMCCHVSCLTCTGNLNTQCLTCPDGRFFNPGTGACDACNLACATCTGPLNTECLTCNAPATQHATISNFCHVCHTECLTCTSANDDHACATCASPFIHDTATNVCYFGCPSGTYKDTPSDR